MDGSDKIVVLMTADDRDVAEGIARGLLERKKAACVGVFPRGTSYYWWKGAIETAEEYLLIAKTKGALLDDFIAAVKQLHGYEVPEIIALPIVGGSEDYLEWLDDELKGEGHENA